MQDTPSAAFPFNVELILRDRIPLAMPGRQVRRGERIAAAKENGSGDLPAPWAGTILEVTRMHITMTAEGDESISPVNLSDLSTPLLFDRLQTLGVGIPRTESPAMLILNAVDTEPGGIRKWLLKTHPTDISEAIKTLERLYRPLRTIMAVPPKGTAALPSTPVMEVADAYPAGLAPLVAAAVTGTEAPQDTIVIGLETLWRLSHVLKTGLPAEETPVTVAGTVGTVRIGTPLGMLLERYALPVRDGDRVVLGGIMRGVAARSLAQGLPDDAHSVDIVRNPSPVAVDAPCVGCGECVRRCPARLDPAMITSYAEFGQYDKAEAEAVDVCFECGLCGYFCIAHRPMLQYIRLAKSELAKAKAQSGEETQP